MLRAAAWARLQGAASCNPPTLSRWSSALMATRERLWLRHADIGLVESALSLTTHPTSSFGEARGEGLGTTVLMVPTGRSDEWQQRKASFRMFGSTSQDQKCRVCIESSGSRRTRWRGFEEARCYARSLGLKSTEEWQEWRKSGLRPRDIPTRPDRDYKDKGWLSWGDFLGFKEGYVPGEHRAFQEARDYVRRLKLKSKEEWNEWRKSDQKPHDMPSTPDQVYKEEGWMSWGDFLGYRPGYVEGEWRTFEDARDYVRSLGLKSLKEWKEWSSKSGVRPHDIHSHPDQLYKDKGWLSWGDFLGYRPGHVARKRSTTERRSFTEARDYVRRLGLKSYKEWKEWSKSGQRPSDIYSNPNRGYKDKGWLSWGDFLGYDEGHDAGAEWRSFEEARDYVRGLGLKSKEEWWEWIKSGQRPSDIPSNPDRVYKGKGWLSWGDFLGYDEGHDAGADWRSFEEARDFVRSLKLKSKKEWHEWSKSDDKPPDIPANPQEVYKGKGWKTWGDFLGSGRRRGRSIL